MIETHNSSVNAIWVHALDENKKSFIKDFSTENIKVVLDSQYNFGSGILWYVIASVDNQKGVLDLLTMEWKIPPAIGNDFKRIHYATVKNKSESINRSDEQNREDSYIYILKDKNTFYDLDMKAYKLKK